MKLLVPITIQILKSQWLKPALLYLFNYVRTNGFCKTFKAKFSKANINHYIINP